MKSNFDKTNQLSFLCKIADLITEVPNIEDLDYYCKDYMCNDDVYPSVVINKELFKYEKYPTLSKKDINYVEAGRLFNLQLLLNDGLYLHSSAVEIDGRAYLFSAPCGTGKSTHTRNWQKYFGEKARVFNDDKPSLRKIDGVWYAYGTPWCGKDHININMKVPLAGICFLKQAPHNKIRRLTPFEAAQNIFLQTIYKYKNKNKLDIMLERVNDIVNVIPIFEFENLPNEEAVQLSYNTMLNAAKEAGL